MKGTFYGNERGCQGVRKCRKVGNRCTARFGPFCPIIRGENTHEVMQYLCIHICTGDCGGTVVKVLCYKSGGRWFDPSWCQWIFH